MEDQSNMTERLVVRGMTRFTVTCKSPRSDADPRNRNKELSPKALFCEGGLAWCNRKIQSIESDLRRERWEFIRECRVSFRCCEAQSGMEAGPRAWCLCLFNLIAGI